MSRVDLGRVLYAEMIKKGWTMTELSTRADVPRPLVVDLLFSDKAVDPAAVMKISEALGIAQSGQAIQLRPR